MMRRLSSVNRGLVFSIGAAALFYLALLPVFTSRLNPLTGDEPFYVMTAISLIQDHDLDESNNYADHDYDEFYPADPLPAGWRGWPSFPRELPPHPAVSTRPGLHTKHGLGVSFLIAVPYAIGGRIGADLVIILCASLLAGQMFLLATEAGADQRLAAAIALALAVAMPIGPYALLIFPEVPAALLLVYAVRRLSAPTNSFGRMILTGTAVGLLPWLHQRFDPTAAVLAVILLVRWRDTRPVWKLAAAFAPIATLGSTLILYNEWLYGQPYQNTHDHAGFNHFAGTVTVSSACSWMLSGAYSSPRRYWYSRSRPSPGGGRRLEEQSSLRAQRQHRIYSWSLPTRSGGESGGRRLAILRRSSRSPPARSRPGFRAFHIPGACSQEACGLWAWRLPLSATATPSVSTISRTASITW